MAAVGSIISAFLLGVVALKAQSAKQQLDEIRKIIEDELDDPGRAAITRELVKRALREVLGDDRGRRWYDNEE